MEERIITNKSFSKYNFKKYLLKQYKPSFLEKELGNAEIFQDGVHYLSVNWDRYYYIIKNFLDFMPINTEKILNVGSFPGSLERVIREYLKNNAEIYATGLGFTDEYLSIMKDSNVQTAEVDIDPPYYEVIDSSVSFNLPYQDHFFDFAFACEIIEHLLNPLHLVKEIKRVLKPNGTFLLTTPNLTDISNIFRMVKGDTINQNLKQSHVFENNRTTRRHVHLYTKDEIEFICKELGFNDIRIFMYNCEHRFRKYSFFKKIKYYLRSIFYVIPMYRTHIYVVCKND